MIIQQYSLDGSPFQKNMIKSREQFMVMEQGENNLFIKSMMQLCQKLFN